MMSVQLSSTGGQTEEGGKSLPLFFYVGDNMKRSLVFIFCLALIGVLAGQSVPVHAEDISEDERVNDFLDAFSSELDRIETAQTVGGVTGPLTNGAINGYTVYGAMNSLEYYYYRYYDGAETGSGRLQPSGSSCSGAYKVEGDDNIYFASCFSFGSSGGQLVSAPHYSMNIDFELISYEDLGLSASDLVTNISTINSAFSYGVVFDVPSYPNNFLKIYYNGTGLFNSSQWQTGAISGYRIAAYITPNNYYPVVTAGYDWGRNAIFSTYNFPDNGRINLDDIFENITISEDEPWEAYNTLIDVFSNRFPDMDLDYVPFHGAQYEPAEVPTQPDPTEPATIPKTTLPVQDYVQPVTEIVEVTNESGEVVETETVIVTETNGDIKYEVQIPSLPMLSIPDVEFPSADVPAELADGITGVWAAIYHILDRTRLLTILPFCLIVGLIVFVITFLG